MANPFQVNKFILINEHLPTFLIFEPNPYKLTINSKKITGKTRTEGGWTYNFAGNEPDTISIEGYTRSKIPSSENIKIANIAGELSIEITRPEYVEWFITQLQMLHKLDKEKFASMSSALRNANLGVSPSALASLTTQNSVLQQITGSVSGQKIKSPDFELAETYIFYRGALYRVFCESFSYTEDASDPSRYSYSMSFTVMGSTTDWLIGNMVSMSDPVARFLGFQTGAKIVTSLRVTGI